MDSLKFKILEGVCSILNGLVEFGHQDLTRNEKFILARNKETRAYAKACGLEKIKPDDRVYIAAKEYFDSIDEPLPALYYKNEKKDGLGYMRGNDERLVAIERGSAETLSHEELKAFYAHEARHFDQDRVYRPLFNAIWEHTTLPVKLVFQSKTNFITASIAAVVAVDNDIVDPAKFCQAVAIIGCGVIAAKLCERLEARAHEFDADKPVPKAVGKETLVGMYEKAKEMKEEMKASWVEKVSTKIKVMDNAWGRKLLKVAIDLADKIGGQYITTDKNFEHPGYKVRMAKMLAEYDLNDPARSL